MARKLANGVANEEKNGLQFPRLSLTPLFGERRPAGEREARGMRSRVRKRSLALVGGGVFHVFAKQPTAPGRAMAPAPQAVEHRRLFLQPHCRCVGNLAEESNLAGLWGCESPS